MRKSHRFFTAIVTMALLMGVSASIALAQDPDNGKLLWEETVWQCKACHGETGEGGWGPPLAGNTNSAQDWMTQVHTPRRSMPAFSTEQISDEQIADMHAYLITLAEPADFTRPDAGLPADAHAGQQLMVEKRCVACHSTTGPIKGYIERGEVPTADIVIAQLRSPRRNMPMFSDGQVSDAEAGLIADFMALEVAEEAPPAALPTSGGDNASNLASLLLIVGGGLLLVGLTLRKYAKQLA